MSMSLTVANAPETQLARGSFTLLATLLARSFGLAAGVAIALLLVAFILAP